MKIFDVSSKLEKTEKQSGALESQLQELRRTINDKRQSITQALIDGKEIASILDEVGSLQKQESGLVAALQAVQAAKAELGSQKKADELKLAEKEIGVIDAELEKAAIQLLRDAYKSRDELALLGDKFTRARNIVAKYPNELSTWHCLKSFEVIAALAQAYATVTRTIEITQPELLQAAGLERRF